MTTPTSDLIVLDGDGVLFDYRKAFPGVWKRAFGTDIEMVRPDAYHADAAYGITWESEAQMQHFFSHFGEEAWATMPLMDGADEACRLLADAGYRLVIVSSMNPEFAAARKKNCEAFGLPIEAVHAVRRTGAADHNPKLATLHALKPLALVDDLKANFEGLTGIHRAFIHYGRFDCPSIGYAGAEADTTHDSLLDFARFWVAARQHTDRV
ncbi:hypothetical protein WJ96_04435 [Burkholderia ubonensis]|uniref:HAD family hydrolase n=1 Tax=Burkholderia ubonensis TaxID=101571 RepID=A0AAW3MWY5_9BURK|nr:HAD family hydrolase [Burkholderia ubonensis]KVP65620.1 hypothetical protein WJ93_24170 [Burkholderia ubonensis]KVP97823.1 hypothetical protein WJ96_04435 [Burkholderia ubonensis]KVZ92520.1 hypothetical protein WL25_16090 [Burkholderia ubonensis]